MRYKCVSVEQGQIWLTLGKIYEGEAVITPKEFSGYILIKSADDKFPAYVSTNQLVGVGEISNSLA